MLGERAGISHTERSARCAKSPSHKGKGKGSRNIVRVDHYSRLHQVLQWEEMEDKRKRPSPAWGSGYEARSRVVGCPLRPYKTYTEWQARTDLRLQSHTLRTPVMFPLTSLLSPSERRSPRAHGLFALSGGRNKFVIIFGEWWQ